MAAGCREFTLRRCQNRQIQITLAQYIVFRNREIIILHPNLIQSILRFCAPYTRTIAFKSTVRLVFDKNDIHA